MLFIEKIEKVFKKVEMQDMVVYWPDDVDVNDLMDDMEWIGDKVCKSRAVTGKDSGIMTVRNEWIDDTRYKAASLYVDERTVRMIEWHLRNKKFKAVRFTSVTM